MTGPFLNMVPTSSLIKSSRPMFIRRKKAIINNKTFSLFFIILIVQQVYITPKAKMVVYLILFY